MDQTTLLIVAAAVVVIGLIAWYFIEQRRRRHLRETFGPEYDRAVSSARDRNIAERELARREQRVRKLDIRSLAPDQRATFASRWQRVQTDFVDSPTHAIAEADRLVVELMQELGYPMTNFDQRAADISVDHPHVVENYRAARAISMRNRSGNASTEELRQAMVHYRALFQDLLETRVEETEVTR
jgi:hypothetical protein